MKRNKHMYLDKICQQSARGLCMFTLLILAAMLFSVPADAFNAQGSTTADVYENESASDSQYRYGNTLLNSLNNGLLVEDGNGPFYRTMPLKGIKEKGCICRLSTDAPEAASELSPM